MKKLLLLVLSNVYIFFHLIAQPNPGFENWHTEATYEVPDSWQTFNFLIFDTPPDDISAFKATGIDKHSGLFALKLKTTYYHYFFPDTLGDSLGFVFLGKITMSPVTFSYGFPYTSRPEKLTFWSKYIPIGNDTGGAAVLLKKWNGTSSDTIATGGIKMTATAGYAFLETNLNYVSDELPDSATIIFLSSISKNCARLNSTLYVDDVALTGWVGVDQYNKQPPKINVFPNPAKDNVNIHVQIDDAEQVEIVDIFNQSVATFNIQNSMVTINTSFFPTGIYFYEIKDKNNYLISKGKFNISR